MFIIVYLANISKHSTIYESKYYLMVLTVAVNVAYTAEKEKFIAHL